MLSRHITNISIIIVIAIITIIATRVLIISTTKEIRNNVSSRISFRVIIIILSDPKMRRNRVPVDERLRRGDDVAHFQRRVALQEFDARTDIGLEQLLADVDEHRNGDKLRRDGRAVGEGQQKVPQREHVGDGELEHEQNRDPAEGVELGDDRVAHLEVLVQLGVAHFEQEREGAQRLLQARVALVVGHRAEVVAAPLHERLEAEEDVGLGGVDLARVAVARGPEQQADHLVHALRVGAAAVHSREEKQHAAERQLSGGEDHPTEGGGFFC